MAELWAVSQEATTKIAARRGLEIIRKLVQSGAPEDLARAGRLAKRPGVLKPSIAGSQIKDLGMGGEGLATLVADPKQGLSVRKLYDPQGMASPEMIRRKHYAGKNLVGEQSIAQYKGQAPTPQGGGTMQFSEYVPGGAMPSSSQAKRVGEQARDAIQQRTPFSNPADIRPGNMVTDPKSGKTKLIDYIPTQFGEVGKVPGKDSATIGFTPKGMALWNDNYRGFGIGQGKELLPKDINALHGQQSAHLKQTFLGRGPATTPAVDHGQQLKMENANVRARAEKRRAQLPGRGVASTGGVASTNAQSPVAMRKQPSPHSVATKMQPLAA